MKVRQIEGLEGRTVETDHQEEPTSNLKKDKKTEIITENKLEKGGRPKKRVDPNKDSFMAPFDLFGVSAKFYIDGRNKTLTWIGCVCSTILVGTILTLFVFQLNRHANKTESLVTSFSTAIEGSEFFDMHAGKQVLAVQYFNLYVPNIPFRTFVDFEFFHVVQSKYGLSQTNKLDSVPCEESDFHKNTESLKGVGTCLEFKSKLEVGYDFKTGVKKYILVQISPCKANCFGYPGDAHYLPTISQFLTFSTFSL